MNYLKEMGAPVTYNNEVKLLMTGHDKFVDLFENIRHAGIISIWNTSTSATTP